MHRADFQMEYRSLPWTGGGLKGKTRAFPPHFRAEKQNSNPLNANILTVSSDESLRDFPGGHRFC